MENAHRVFSNFLPSSFISFNLRLWTLATFFLPPLSHSISGYEHFVAHNHITLTIYKRKFEDSWLLLWEMTVRVSVIMRPPSPVKRSDTQGNAHSRSRHISLPRLMNKPYSIPHSLLFLPLSVASCCVSIQLVPYDAVNRNKVSIRHPPFSYFPTYLLHVSAPTGHLQVRYTIRCF
jgi:hypothetical protein